MTIDEIINRIKEGETLSISCARYEESIYSKRGEYRSYVEDGIHETSKKVDEKYIIHEVIRAMLNSEYFDLYLGDENILKTIRTPGD